VAYEGGCEPEVVTLSLADGPLIDGAMPVAWYASCPADWGVTTLGINAQSGVVWPKAKRVPGACTVNGC
jgi:hypothetical protein